MGKDIIAIFSDRITAFCAVMIIFLILGWATIALIFIGRFFSKRDFSWKGLNSNPISEKNCDEKGHLSCSKISDIFLLIDLHKDHTRTIVDLMSSQSILSEQKIYARNTASTLINTAERKFREYLISKQVPSIAQSKEYNVYTRYIDDVRRYCFELFVEACEENNFAKKTEKEFEAYLKTKVSNIVEETQSYAFKIMPELLYGLDGHRSFIFSSQESIEMAIEDAIRNARNLAIEKKKKIEVIDSDFTEKQKKILSGDQTNEI